MSGTPSARDRYLRLKAALLVVLVPCSVLGQAPATQPATTQAVIEPPAGKRVAFAPGITIDWSVPQVEVDARVVLREGPLELLICRDNSKEHESILATAARPRKLYEALGLIGLAPGRPMSYEPTTDRYTPATGQRLALEVHYRDGGEDKIIATHEWLTGSETKEPIAPPVWVFCGSRTAEGVFAADVEGTIATVVDFDSALMGLADRHSALNAELWLTANTSVIPPKGTPCKLVISGLDVAPLVLTLTPEGFFLWEDEVLDPLELDTIIRWRTRHFPAQSVELLPMDVDPLDVKRMNLFVRVAARAIVGSGIAQENMIFDLLEEPPQEDTVATPAPSEPVASTTTKPASAPAPTTQPGIRDVPSAPEIPTTQPVKGIPASASSEGA